MASQQELLELLVDGARYGDMEDVEAALAQNVPVDSKDAAGRTALHMACANGHEDIVRKLIDAGADVEAKNNEGNTALHWACLNGHKSVVLQLLSKQASPSSLNNAGRTPVDECISRDAQEILDVINSYSNANGGDQVQVEVEEVEGDEMLEGEDDGEDEGPDGQQGTDGPL